MFFTSDLLQASQRELIQALESRVSQLEEIIDLQKETIELKDTIIAKQDLYIVVLPYVGIVRLALTVWVLVMVYQGSRLALVGTLVAIVTWIELHDLIRRWERKP